MRKGEPIVHLGVYVITSAITYKFESTMTDHTHMFGVQNGAACSALAGSR